jgi:hypothetical protein
MEGEKMEEVTEERDIGVSVINNLKPSSQCAKAAATARAVLGQISRTFHYRDRVTFVKLYKTCVRPHLEFSTPAWSPWSQMDKDCLKKVQIKMVQMISGLSGKTYEEKLTEIGLESLENRRTELDICMAHKLLHGVGELDSNLWFDKMPVGQVTRTSMDPINIRSRNGTLDFKKQFFSTRVIKFWNKIPVPCDVKSISSPEKFKTALRKWKRGVYLELQRD